MASTHRRAVGIFSSRPQTASALQALSDSGFSMGDVSIIAQDADHQKDIAGISVKDEVTNQANTAGKVGAATGGILGGVTGLLVGLGTLTIPGLGPALLAGEAAVVMSTLVGGAAGAAAGGLVGALVGMGIPRHRAERYRDRVAQGDYLVMLKGSEHDIAQAEQTLTSAGIEDWGVYPVVDEPRQMKPNSDRVIIDAHNGGAVGDRPGDQRLSDRRDPNVGDRPAPNSAGLDSADARFQSAVDTRTTETVPRHRQADLRPHGPASNGENPLSGQFQRENLVTVQSPDRDLPRSATPLSNPIDDRDFNGSADRPRPQSLTEERRVVGIFLSRDAMEAALEQLQQTGFPMHTLSMAVREAEAPDQGQAYYSHSLAGATRLTAGLDRILLPEVGPVLVMGPDAQALANTFVPNSDGSGTHRSRNGATDLGIAPESAHLYRRHLTSGAYLITLRGHNQDLLQAAATLGERGMHDWGIYDVSYAEAHR